MKHYLLRTARRKEDVLYLSLEPKSPRDRFTFEPGQYATISFRAEDGRPSPMRCFSIVSSPLSRGELQFAIRIGGAFTQKLTTLAPGTRFDVQGPFGEFVADERYDKHIVMIAGGIGITPFMSRIRTATQTGSPTPLTLLYSARAQQDIPFYTELQEHMFCNPNLHATTFVTGSEPFAGRPSLVSGKMSEDHLRQVVAASPVETTYFLCGPKGFVASVMPMLSALQIPDDRILTESFTQSSKITIGKGYSPQKLAFALAGFILLVGIGGIAAIDLSRYVPKHTQAATTVTTTPVTAASSSDDSEDSSPTVTTTPSTSSSSSSTTPTTTQSRHMYQAPVSSVS